MIEADALYVPRNHFGLVFDLFLFLILAQLRRFDREFRLFMSIGEPEKD